MASSSTEDVLDMWNLSVDDIGLLLQNSFAVFQFHAPPVESTLAQQLRQSLRLSIKVLIMVSSNVEGVRSIEGDVVGGEHRDALSSIFQGEIADVDRTRGASAVIR